MRQICSWWLQLRNIFTYSPRITTPCGGICKHIKKLAENFYFYAITHKYLEIFQNYYLPMYGPNHCEKLAWTYQSHRIAYKASFRSPHTRHHRKITISPIFRLEPQKFIKFTLLTYDLSIYMLKKTTAAVFLSWYLVNNFPCVVLQLFTYR